MKHGEVRIYHNPELPFLEISDKIRFILPSNRQIFMESLSTGAYHAEQRYSLISPSILGVWSDDC